jgi:hypothetical protein
MRPATEASLRLGAGDTGAAMAAVDAVLALESLTFPEASQARELRAWINLVVLYPPDTARSGQVTSGYERRPFGDAHYWAPFILVGDPL